MKFLYCHESSPRIYEFPVYSNRVIHKGDPVALDKSYAYKSYDTGFIGIAAEDHSGVADDMNPRSNGTSIKIMCSNDAVYELSSPIYTVTETYSSPCTETLIEAEGPFTYDNNESYLVLIKKGEGSTNTDPIGKLRRVSAVIDSGFNDIYDFTVATGGVACVGDQYALIPMISCKKVRALSEDTWNIDYTASTFVCVGVDLSKIDGNGTPPTVHVKIRNSPLLGISE